MDVDEFKFGVLEKWASWAHFFLAMDTREILKGVEEIVIPVLENLGYTLVEREFVMESGRFTLRLCVDKEGSVTIDDCARASRAVEDIIEVEGLVPGSYNLEVSSPGINRPLRYKRDFERFTGSLVKLKTLNQIDGRGNYRGVLNGLEGDDILINVDGIQYRVPYSQLAKARILEHNGG